MSFYLPIPFILKYLWTLILQAYKYDVKYRPSSEHATADALNSASTVHWPTHEGEI